MMNYLHTVREFATPLLEKSNFSETGVITPQEFVNAGDFLVYKCPTWEWSSGEGKKSKKFLPSDKQYLITRHVSCFARCNDLLADYTENMENGWTIYEKNVVEIPDTDIPHVSELSENSDVIPDISDIPDIPDNISNMEKQDDFEGFYMMQEEDPATLDNIVRGRTYDIGITYDKYYQTPRVWLIGYGEDGNVLNNTQMYQDISPDHANKTVTFESHPHENLMCLGIHPCKHASVMRKLIKRTKASMIRPDQYLYIFLKFIGTIIPTIEYDYTASM